VNTDLAGAEKHEQRGDRAGGSESLNPADTSVGMHDVSPSQGLLKGVLVG
jgi:hypothetical protein